MLAVAYDNETGEGDLVYAKGGLVSEGFDLETALLLSLLLDAPALPGDALPAGAPRRGWWGDAYTGDSKPLGSRLWLLEDALATPQAALRAKQYAEEACAWAVTDGHVRAIAATAELRDDPITPAVLVEVAVTLKDERTVTLGPFKVN